MKQVRILINDLIDQHEDYSNCPGCEKCDEIASLRKHIDRDPKEKYQRILAKGREMTKSEIKLLLDNGVDKRSIFTALKMSSTDFYKLLKNYGFGEVGIVKITKEEYMELSGQGLKDKEIAEQKDVHPGYLSQLKKEWGVRTASKKPEKKGEYNKLFGELKQQLSSKGKEIKGLEDKITRTIEEYESKLEEQKKENQAEKKAKEWAQREYARVQNELEKTDYELQNTKHAGEKIREVMEGCISENKALWIIVKELVTVCSPK